MKRTHFLICTALFSCLGMALDTASAQSIVDFRESIRSVETSLATVTVSANDNVAADVIEREKKENAKNDPRPAGPRIQWLDENEAQGNRLRRAQRNVAADVTSAAFAVEQDLLIAYVGGPADTVEIEDALGDSQPGTVLVYDNVTGLAAIKVENAMLDPILVTAAESEPGLPVVAAWINGSVLTTDAGMVATRPIPQSSALGLAPSIDFGGSSQMAGAPVLDASGIIVGVMVPGGSVGGNSPLVCVRGKEVMRLIESAKSDNPTHLKRGLVGIQFTDQGSLVSEVSPNSGAADAGIQPGDLVERVNEIEVRSATDVVSAVAGARAGDTLEITVKRDGDSIVIPVTLTEHPQQQLAQNGSLPESLFGPRGFAMRQAWELKDGELVPMEIDPNQLPNLPEMGQFPMDQMLRQFNAPFGGQQFGGQQFGGQQFGGRGFQGPIDGFRVERSEVEKSLQELQRQMEQLNQKLDQQN